MGRERRVSVVACVGVGRRLLWLVQTLLLVVLLSSLATKGLRRLAYKRVTIFNFPSLKSLEWRLWNPQGAEGLLVCLLDHEVINTRCYGDVRSQHDPYTPGCVLPDVVVRFTLLRSRENADGVDSRSLFQFLIQGRRFFYVEPHLFCYRMPSCTFWDLIHNTDDGYPVPNRTFIDENSQDIFPQAFVIGNYATESAFVHVERFDLMLSLWTPTENLLSRVMYLAPALQAISEENALDEDDYETLFSIVTNHLREDVPSVHYLTNDNTIETSDVFRRVQKAKVTIKWLYLKHVIGDPKKRLFKDELNTRPHVTESGIPVCKNLTGFRRKEIRNMLDNSFQRVPVVQYVESQIYAFLKCTTLKSLAAGIRVIDFGDNLENVTKILKGVEQAITTCDKNCFHSMTDPILAPLIPDVEEAPTIKPVSEMLNSVAVNSIDLTLHRASSLVRSMLREPTFYPTTVESEDFPRCMALIVVSQRLELLQKKEKIGDIFNRVLKLLRPSLLFCEEMLELPGISGRPKELRTVIHQEEQLPAESVAATEAVRSDVIAVQGGGSISLRQMDAELLKVLCCAFVTFTVEGVDHLNYTSVTKLTGRDIQQLEAKDDLCKEMRVGLVEMEPFIYYTSETAAFFTKRNSTPSLNSGANRQLKNIFHDASSEVEEQDGATPVGSSKPEEQEATAAVSSSRPGPPVGSSKPEEQEAAAPVGSAKLEEQEAAASVGSSKPEEEETAAPVGSAKLEEQEAAAPVGSEKLEEQEAAAPVGSAKPEEEEAAASVGSSKPEEEEAAAAVGSSKPEDQEVAAAVGSSKVTRQATVENREPERSWLLMGSAGTLVLGLACVSGVVAHGRAHRASEQAENAELDP